MLEFQEDYRGYIRSSNILEQVTLDTQSRNWPSGFFNSNCFIATSEDWETGEIYLTSDQIIRAI